MKDVSFLYGNSPHNQYTGRIEVHLMETVDGGTLRDAVAMAEQRYPYFRVKVVRDEHGELDIVPNDAPIPVTKGEEPVCLGTDEANNHYVAVAYDDRNLYFDFYHPLTDAAGFIPFIKTVLYYYLCDRYQVEIDPTGINLAGSEIPYEEICEPEPQFETDNVKPFYEYRGVQPFSLFTDAGMKQTENIVYRIKIRESDLMKYAKSNDGSPNVILSVFLCKAIAQNHADTELPIVGGIAINVRPAYGLAPTNYHNLVNVMHLKYDKSVWDWDISKLLTCSRGMILLQSQPENFVAGSNNQKSRLYNYIMQQDTDEARWQAMMKLMESHNLDTFDISYVGRVPFGSLEEYIDGVYTITYPSVGKGISIKMNAVNGYFTMTFVQKFAGDTYINNFLNALKTEGIEYLIDAPTPVITPKVNTYRR